MSSETSKGIISRPPVVVVMGHIDHGKSTLLDYIRKSNVVAKEAGGITQHISAYEVVHKDEKGLEKKITFLDTPGHEAFKAMRSRGANVADVALLIVSAEDGVKPQTIEALGAITSSKTPYVVVINKIDKPEANIERTKQSLVEAGIYIEGYGGSIPAIPLSAKTGEGVGALLDMILLVSELESFTGNKDEPASGTVIESSLDTKKGISATIIIKNGTLRKGEFIASGESVAPVRIMENFLGDSIDEATFSSPVKIIGWNILPKAGDMFKVAETKQKAEVLAQSHKELQKKQSEDFAEIEGVAIIPILVKADTLGGTEAIVHEIKKIETETVHIKIVEASAGNITESDVKLLSGNERGIIIGLGIVADGRALELGERQGVTIKTFDVIYKIAEWLKEIVKERTPKVTVEEKNGVLKVLKVFSKNKDKQVIGGKVESGKIAVNDTVHILRRDVVIGIGNVLEVQVQKLKTREANEGSECGILVEARVEISGGDRLESFVLNTK